MKKYIPTAVFLFFSCCLFEVSAQMEVTDAATAPFTPQNLISNIFLGDGVSIIDISYDGDPRAVGYFKDGENTIGLNRGILLTSGRAASLSCNGGPFGADCNGNVFADNIMNSNVTDTDLTSIANGTPQDVAKYTITFQPFADTLRFRYVFASEEYPEYSCSPFNDVFGFFISGPSINGTYSNNGENIALIPGTNTPVSIDNIHPQDGPDCNSLNGQYYNNNNGFPVQPVYDGYLDVFTAEAVVIPCETYTIKLMISDVSDDRYDSGVFLEAKSFGTGTIEVEAATISQDGVIMEGCVNGTVTFSIPQEAEQDLFLDYTIIGDAINGIDYEFIDTDLFIPEGSSTISIDVVAFSDGIDDDFEGIGIDIQRDICNRDTFWFYIRDNQIQPPTLGPDPTICEDDSIQLDGTLPIPLPDPPTFTNDQNYFVDETEPVYSPIQVIGVQPTTLGPGVIQSVCVNIAHNWVDDLDLYLLSPGGQFIELSSMNGSNCDNYNNVCFSPLASTPINYVFPWPNCSSGEEPGFSNGTFQPEGVWSDLWDGDFPTNGTWQLLVIDGSNGFDGEILDWTITFEPLYQLNYSWTPSQGLSCGDCPDPMAMPNETTTYNLTVWDTYGCEVYDTITINVEEMPEAPIINCVSVTNNSIEFVWEDVFGATNYQVSINGMPFTNPNNGSLSHLVTGLNMGDSVTIEVMGIGNCLGLIGSATCTTPNCDAPSLIINSLVHVDCNGDVNGLISASATGGAGDYVFTLDNGMSNPDGVFPSLSGGTYLLTVEDSWGCPNSISVTINEPDELVVVEEILNHVTCFEAGDASVTLDIMGGTAPYLIDWSNGQQQDTAVNLLPGSHFVFVTDANGCTENFNFQITQPPEIELTLTAQNIGCAGAATGSATVFVEGGVAPYFITWDANAGNATTPTVDNLLAGSYTVAVTDANGCLVLGEVFIDQSIGLVTSIEGTDVNCFDNNDGTASVTVSGGSPPYSYEWSNGETGPIITGLPPGTYSVTVTDVTGCVGDVAISIGSPPQLELSLFPVDALCENDPTGSISSEVTGGTPPYSYQWDNGQTNDILPDIVAGTYCLTIIDANGCEISNCETVSAPNEMTLTADASNASCNSAEGMIDLNIQGGTSPYSIVWSNGLTSQDAAGLLPGDYTVTVTDANNCTASITETILETAAITVDFSTADILCKGENTGSIQINVTGGSGDYSYDWTGSNGYSSTMGDLTDLPAGVYSLDIEDTDGCAFNAMVEILEPAEALDAFYSAEDISCPGLNDGSISIEAVGGSPPYLYDFNNNGFFGNPNFLALSPGLYNAIVQDDNGCQFELADMLIGDPVPFSVDLGSDLIVLYGESVFMDPDLANVDPANYNDYTYQWISTNPNVQPNNPNWLTTYFNPTGATTVSLTVTSNSGCVAEDQIDIFVLTQREIEVPTGFTPGIDGPSENNLLHVHGKSGMVEKIKSFQVFDRWGELLYEAFDFQINDLNIGWDGTFKGKEMPAGVYVWHAEVDYIDGLTESYKGHTTLIR